MKNLISAYGYTLLLATVLAYSGCGRTKFSGQPTTCGNGTLDPGELCDDGNTSNEDGCLSSCVPAACGDGYTRTGVEECDDGNLIPGDGCSMDCRLESGLCGNGALDPGEECDDGNFTNTDGCLNDCTAAFCGDGYVWVGVEECDDGNNIDGDGCSAICRSELVNCGNGILEPGEDCDDGNNSNTDACLNTCRAASCGDGHIWIGVEQCDDGNTTPGDGCSAICMFETSVCGNGMVEQGEECDDGNNSNNDACLNTCINAYCGDTYLWIGVEQCDDGNTQPGDGCSAICRLETAVCGNGTVEQGEQCDDGNNSNNDACLNTCFWASCGDGYLWLGVEECDDGNTNPGDGCGADCRIETTTCGNGILDAGEQCDDGNQNVNDFCPDGPQGTCQWAQCGDGFVWFGVEQCDDGNGNINDACPDGPFGSCRAAECGDGYLWIGVEQCDDGNTQPGDGCGATCRLETSNCGNGVVEPGEDCDDANGSNNDACLNTCVAASCGDGYLWFGVEQCDDGNNVSGDGCSAICTIETAECGNGVLDAGEQCDDGNQNVNDWCPDGPLGTCQWAQCGDGFVWTGVEECDDGNNLPGDGCSPICTLEGAVCGNGIPEAGEVCDDGNTANCDGCRGDCSRPDDVCGDFITECGEECDDGNTTPGDGCSATCTLETTVCGNGIPEPPEVCDDGNTANCDGCRGDCSRPDDVCGDSIPECGEACDDGNNSNNDACLNTCVAATCGDGFVWLGMEECDDGNNQPGDGCAPDCTLETANCGNGIPEPPEECDDGNNSNNDACLNTCQDATCGDGFTWIGVEECDDGNTQPGDGCDANCQLEATTCVPDWTLVCGGADNWSTEWNGSTDAVDNYSCIGWNETGPEYTYTFDSAANQTVTLTLSNLNVNLDVFVLDGSAVCDGNNCLAYGDNNVTFPAQANTTYYIVVDGRNGASGNYRIDMDCAECGNGVPEAGEECDDGNNSNNDACLNDCTVATCGDGHVWAGVEECDDGNTQSGDGCSATCTLETADCGNGIPEPPEECDDGNNSNYDACLNTCVAATCGDGFVWTGVEECDDGNTQPGDGCDANCQLEPTNCVPDWTLDCGGSDWWNTNWNGSTDQVGIYSCSGWNESGPEYAYTFTSNADQQASVTLSGMSVNLDVFVLNGANCDPTACIAFGNTSATFQAQAGQTYSIVVDGRNGASGNYNISLDCSQCGNGILEGTEECDMGPLNEDRFALTVWQQNGLSLGIRPIERWTDAYSFYGYTSVSAHTGYEAVGRSLGFLYRDYNTGILSLFVIHGIDFDTTGQWQDTTEVDFRIYDFPPGTTLNRSDDGGEFNQTSPTEYFGDWWFRGNTDGGVVSDIAYPDNWTIVVDPTWYFGLTEWVWVDHVNQFHALDMSKDLYITADTQPVLCRTDCTIPVCGDGILDPGELCDDGNTINGDGCAANCQSVP